MEKVYVKWNLKNNEYVIEDWSSSPCEEDYEEYEVNESLLRALMKINPDNLEWLGWAGSVDELRKLVHDFAIEHDCEEESKRWEIQFESPGFYLVCSRRFVDADLVGVCPALSALDAEWEAYRWQREQEEAFLPAEEERR
jgi:hypothetical protein